MQIIRRFISCMLSIVIMCGLCPSAAVADQGVDALKAAPVLIFKTDEVIASGISNSCEWQIDSEGTLTVKPIDGQNGVLGPWDDLYGPPWLAYRNDIKSARFEGEVHANTCQRLFYCCENLVSLDLTGLDTTNVSSMQSMFWNCSKLTTLDVSSLNTSKTESMFEMFGDCSRLLNLDVSKFDTSNVQNMYAMFYDCRALTALDVSNFDTSHVVYMDDMFAACDKISTLDVSGFNTSQVTRMDGMFSGCGELTALDVSGFDTSQVTDMRSMFWCCYKLASLDVSKFDTSNVRNMCQMFDGCSSLAALDVSGFDTSHVGENESIGTGRGSRSMASMFQGCSSLVSLDVSHFDTSNATDMSGMFFGCRLLNNLDVSGFVTSSVKFMNNMFKNCYSLSSLDVTHFDTSHVTDMSGMFSRCEAMTSLNVSGFDTSQVASMNDMFSDCSSLSAIDVSSFNTSNVVDMSHMFSNCSAIASLNISGFDIANVDNLEGIFSGCSALTLLNLDGWRNTTLKPIGFEDCSSLACVSVGEYTGPIMLPYSRQWYSQTEGKWYYTSEIAESRSRIADTYTNSSKGSDLSRATILGYPTSNAYYHDSPITFPDLTVKFAGTTLTENVDYTVRYSGNDRPGKATITVSGINFYTGSKVVEFRIVDANDASYSDIQWTSVTFGVSYPADGDSWTPMRIKWGFDLFDMSPIGGAYTTGYDNRLSIASAVLSEAAYSESLAYKVFGELGIRDVFRSEKYDEHLMNQPATSMGYTKAVISGKEKNLFVVAVRGTLDATDLGTDAGSWMQAFEPSTDYVKGRLDSFIEYVESERPESKNLENVVLITGHSLGGAVAGRLTEHLSGDSRFSPENSFCYTFAAPNWTYSHTNSYYRNIKNIVNYVDVVPKQNLSAAYRNGIDIGFSPKSVPGFSGKFATVTKGRDYDNLASWDFIATGGNIADAAVKVNHQLDVYMAYLLCEYGAEELWEYQIGNVKRVSAHCPVDVEVIDSYGDTVAKVVDNEVIASSLRVQTVVNSDEKDFYIYDDDRYTIKLIGNDEGAMSLVFDEVNPKTLQAEIIDRQFANIALQKGKTMESSFGGQTNDDTMRLFVLDDEGQRIAEVDTDGTELSDEQHSIESAEVSLSSSSFTFNGQEIEPEVETVAVDGETLIAGEDYRIVYEDNIYPGEGKITIVGINEWSDSKVVMFRINPANVSEATIIGIEDKYYTGEALTQAVTVKLGARTLTVNTDYTVTYRDNINVGKATVVVQGAGCYEGTKTATFNILTQVSAAHEEGLSMHRLYNPYSGEHFYTASDTERDQLKALGWNDEGEGWTAPATSSTPVFRLYNAYAGDHHYTTSASERDALKAAGWSYEGVGWYSDDSKKVPLFRQYNPYATTGSHNYTTSQAENDQLVALGWRAEGVGWYGV